MTHRILNLGILAHVDAGKTTLTERLLYLAGVITQLGSVDRGTTQTDTLALERQRGITIKAAVVSFPIGDVTVNLIDTPGHPDFIAEVERVLGVLDGAVLVVSAVEGVQAQTRVLMRTLQRLGIPTLLFVNKIDRVGADPQRVLSHITERLTPDVIALNSARSPGTRAALAVPLGADDGTFTARLIDLLAARDDDLLAAYLENESGISYRHLRCCLAAQTGRALVHPALFGSAITGTGVEDLMATIAELLPASNGDAGAPVAGTVFKIERGSAGEKSAYVRLFGGTICTRDLLPFGDGKEEKVTAVAVFDRGPAARRDAVHAGQIGKLWGLAGIQIGDTIGRLPAGPFQRSRGHHFDPPTLETVIVPRLAADRPALHLALTQLAEQDPLINLRQDGHGDVFLSLYGEVQKEVIEATLREEYGIAVDFRETSVIHIERPCSTGEAAEWLGKGGNPFLATAGLRVEPGAEGSGIQFRQEVDLVSIPLYIYKSVEEFERVMADTVRTVLQQGLYGWQVTDCTVTLTASGYASPASSARDFRLLTPLVLMEALQAAGTTVHEPVQRIRLEVPLDCYGAAVSLLARLDAVLRDSAQNGTTYVLEGEIPAGRLHDLQQEVPAISRGEGVLENTFGCYRPVSGPPPSRARSDHNPLNRKEYLLHVLRRV